MTHVTRKTSSEPANDEMEAATAEAAWDPLAYARSRLRPMAPLPTKVPPRLSRQRGVRAVLFDIYGTLLVSAAGDAGYERRERGVRAMEQLLPRLKGGGAPPALPAAAGGRQEAEEWLDRYERILTRRLEQVAASGVDFPEVDIREVWTELLESSLAPAGAVGPLAPLAEEFALRFECEANPCWEMPGASELLRGLRAAGLPLGVVSNAQHDTEAVFAAALGLPLRQGLFDQDLAFYSWLEGRGKPSPALFERARAALARRGIAADETLYLGNDLVKDVLPAAAVGFRTALFAGDARSLRCGGGTPVEAAEAAGLVVTRLGQVAEILGL